MRRGLVEIRKLLFPMESGSVGVCLAASLQIGGNE